MAHCYLVGIAGGTGSGKTTLASALVDGLGAQAVRIQHDSYYAPRPNLSADERDALNFDHPDALDSALLARQLDALCAGQSIAVPRYDFTTHLRRPETRQVAPAPVVVVEGILLLAATELRQRFNLKVFVDTPDEVRVMRRTARDMQSRGRSFEQVCAQYAATVQPMHEQYVAPSQQHADLTLSGTAGIDDAVGQVRQALSVAGY